MRHKQDQHQWVQGSGDNKKTTIVSSARQDKWNTAPQKVNTDLCLGLENSRVIQPATCFVTSTTAPHFLLIQDTPYSNITWPQGAGFQQVVCGFKIQHGMVGDCCGIKRLHVHRESRSNGLISLTYFHCLCIWVLYTLKIQSLKQRQYPPGRENPVLPENKSVGMAPTKAVPRCSKRRQQHETYLQLWLLGLRRRSKYKANPSQRNSRVSPSNTNCAQSHPTQQKQKPPSAFHAGPLLSPLKPSRATSACLAPSPGLVPNTLKGTQVQFYLCNWEALWGCCLALCLGGIVRFQQRLTLFDAAWMALMSRTGLPVHSSTTSSTRQAPRSYLSGFRKSFWKTVKHL